MFSFMITDENSTLKLCKHCGKIFVASRSNVQFCSPQCKNQYNVYKCRAKRRISNDQWKDEIVLFENGELALEVNVSPQLETVWLSSNQMALLYGRDEKPFESMLIKFLPMENWIERATRKNACCWCHSASCFLQPRCHHIRRLSCQFKAGHRFS